MSRPLYETSGDRGREDGVRRLIERRWNCTATKLPMQYHLDFGLYRGGELVAFAEVKCRKTPFANYPTYIISLSKVVAALDLSAAAGRVPALLVVNWADVVGWVNLAQAGDWKVRSGGRTDRGDWQDVEPVVEIPIEEFSVLEQGEKRALRIA